ncbi:MAG: dihydrodipicolinate synthase family protein [Fimbriimonadaceae bacterium]|nr:dihydrodipicolinate synthase family protein [Fimbriimonadaceae bacterium]
MLPPGLYPASVTPFDDAGRVDPVSLARLCAWFEAAGCAGIVLGGSNGEGASLSAVERRDLLRHAGVASGSLKLILGVPTPSLDEAQWLASQAGRNGAAAILLSPPAFFRRASDDGVAAWLMKVMDAATCPVLLYHNPEVIGRGLPLHHLTDLAAHPRCGGAKNSAADPELLGLFRSAFRSDQALFHGDERMIVPALEAGWTGAISGCANAIPAMLARLVEEWADESGAALQETVLPLLDDLRRLPQPQSHKAALHAWGILSTPDPRLPLEPVPAAPELEAIRRVLGGAILEAAPDVQPEG